MRFTTFLMLALLTGCAPAVSIHPLYTSQDLVADPSFEGTWTEQDGDIWQIRQSGDGYEVTVLHGGETTSTEAFNVHLLKLKDTEFVDVTSKTQADLSITGHLFAKVSPQGDQFQVALMDDDWLKKTVQAGLAPQAVAGENNGQVILTAPTSDLQRFILLHADDGDAWYADAGSFHRVR